MKKKGFKLLALAVITACCFGISAASAFAADGETKTAMNGASIRTNKPTGLRFEAVVDAATYDSAIADGKSFGAFILPKDYLTAANITAITNHKDQFTAVEKYLEKEDVAGELKGSVYTLKYSIADLHYYNYNRVFVGMFFIKTVGADNAVSYQYFTVNAANNERSVAFVAKAAVENGSEVPDIAYDFLIAAKYLEVNGYDSTKEEATQKSEADAFVTANKEGFKTAYTAIKAAADIEKINILDATQKPKIQAARKAYDEADAVIKDLLDDFDIYNKFVANETAYQAAEALGLVETVNNAIAALPEYNASTVIPVIYNKNYKTAKDAYDSLTEEQKAQITDYAKLKKYEDAAKNVKSLYTSIDNFTSSVTVVAEGVGSTPGTDDDYGDVYEIRGQNNGNVYLKFNSYADLTGYDVVRFPIFMTGATNQNSLHKYSTDSDLVGYHTLLTPGWNIITVPVSFMMNGFVLGGSMLPGMTWLHYAIPYMEKLENGSKLSIGDLSASQHIDGSYAATVTFAKEQDPNEGRVLKVITAASGNSNYAFKIKNFKEYQKIVADSGATGVKFKIKKLGTGGSIMLYMPHAESGHDADKCLKEITMTQDKWVEVSLTAEEFARWKDGFFRRTWGAGAQFLMTDFTIVK